MKLPGADTTRGFTTLGREQDDLLSVGRAKFAAASAKGAIAQAMGQTAAVIEAWAIADQETKANKALADYRKVITDTVTDLSKSAAIPVDAMPEGVSYKKEETTASGQVIERTSVPSWEVAPAIYDKAHNDASSAAVKQVRHAPTRAKLEIAIQNTNTQGRDEVAKFHLEGRKQHMIGENEAAIQVFVREPNGAGVPAAINTVNSMVSAGLLTPKQGVDRKLKILHDADDYKFTKRLASLLDTKNVAGLDQFSADVLGNTVMLSADEKRGYATTAMRAAERLSKEQGVDDNKAKLEESKKLLGTYETQIRLEGKSMSSRELLTAKDKLTGSDYLTLVAVLDRRDGNKGVITDVSTYRSIENQIHALRNPVASGLPLDKRVELIDNQISAGVIGGKIDSGDREKLFSLLMQHRDYPTKASPKYNQAVDSIEANLLPARGVLAKYEDLEDVTRWTAIANDMKVELATAMNANPQQDPLVWVNQNITKYKDRARELPKTKLYELGFSQYVVTTPEGVFDATASYAKALKDWNEKRLTVQNYIRIYNALQLGDVNAQIPKQGAAERRK